MSIKLTGADSQGDRITVQAEQDRFILDLHSKSGMGRAEISAEHGNWPEQLILRLHLRGLESFEVSDGLVTIRTQVQSRPPYAQSCEVLPADGLAGPAVEKDSPYWIPLQIIHEQEPGDRQIPIEKGYLELTVPAILLEGEPETLSIQWIDFYRG